MRDDIPQLQGPDDLAGHILVLGAPCILIVLAALLLLYTFWEV